MTSEQHDGGIAARIGASAARLPTLLRAVFHHGRAQRTVVDSRAAAAPMRAAMPSPCCSDVTSETIASSEDRRRRRIMRRGAPTRSRLDVTFSGFGNPDGLKSKNRVSGLSAGEPPLNLKLRGPRGRITRASGLRPSALVIRPLGPRNFRFRGGARR